MHRQIRVFAPLAIFLLLLLCAACVPDDKEYSEFKFDETVPVSEPVESESLVEPVTPEVATQVEIPIESPAVKEQVPVVPVQEPKQPVDDTSSLLSCMDDGDCVLVQPAACCSCPLAISRLYGGEYPTIKLGQVPECSTVCGVCFDYTQLEARCHKNQCVAAKEGEMFEEEQEPVVYEIISYPDPLLDSSSNFYEVDVKPGCVGSYNSVHILATTRVPTITQLQAREDGASDYMTIAIEDRDLYDPEFSIPICDGCTLNKNPSLHIGKTYHLRLHSEFKGEVTYAGDYTIDTTIASEYRQKTCGTAPKKSSR